MKIGDTVHIVDKTTQGTDYLMNFWAVPIRVVGLYQSLSTGGWGHEGDYLYSHARYQDIVGTIVKVHYYKLEDKYFYIVLAGNRKIVCPIEVLESTNEIKVDT